jgi:histone H3/H4
MYNHRESWALENRAPKELTSEDLPAGSEPQRERSAQPGSSRKVVSDREKFISGLGSEEAPNMEEREQTMTEETSGKEILIVASKLKNYVRAKSGMNTSAAVIDVLSDKVRELCDQAVEAAKRDGRKTVMDRDFG